MHIYIYIYIRGPVLFRGGGAMAHGQLPRLQRLQLQVDLPVAGDLCFFKTLNKTTHR